MGIDSRQSDSYTKRMDAVGQHIRALRQERGLSLNEVARRSQLSPSFISQVERELCSISISSLHEICSVLGINLAEFFASLESAKRSEDPARRLSEVLKEGSQPSVTTADAAIRYRFLTREFPNRKLEIVIAEITPGHHYPLASHGGEEFGYVLRGRLRLMIRKQEHLLGPGDSYHFDASVPHGYEAEGDDPVRVMWVGTMRSLSVRDSVRPAPT